MLRIALLLLAASASVTGQQSEPPPLRVHGRVTDEVGRPLEGVGFTVAEPLQTIDALERPLARTGADGRLEVVVPGPGGDRVGLLHVAGRVCRRVMLSETVGAGGHTLHVAFGTLRLEPAREIRVTVLDPDRRPVVGARVTSVDALRDQRFQLRWGGTNHGIAQSHAVTDGRGRATLLGVPLQGARLWITAPGFYHARVDYADASSPVFVELRAAELASGTVTEHDGAPADVVVSIASRAQPYPPIRQRTVDGEFRVELPQPGSYDLRCYRAAGGTEPVKIAEGRPGEPLAIELEPPRVEPAQPELVVRVFDTAGTPIPGARAAVVWLDEHDWEAHDVVSLDRKFGRRAVAADASGAITLRDAWVRGITTGRVLVRAPGYAREILTAVPVPEPKTEVRVTLGPEAAIEGKVVDIETGEPVAGARVARLVLDAKRFVDPPPFRPTRGDRPGHVVTDARGRFRMRELAAGTYQLVATGTKRPEGVSRTIELEAAQTARDCVIELPRGADVRGRVTGLRIEPGWKVAFQRPETNWRPEGGWDGWSRGRPRDRGRESVDLGMDGRFAFRGLEPGEYRVSLSVAGLWTPFEVPIETIDVGTESIDRELDLTGKRPATLHGAVAIAGDEVLPWRTMVVALPRTRRVADWDEPARFRGHQALVGADGKYSMRVPAGTYRVRVVDLATGVLVHRRERLVEVALGDVVEQSFAVALAEVRVRLIPSSAAEPKLVTGIEVRVKGGVRDLDAELDFGRDHDTGIGVKLDPTQLETTLFLPPFATQLRVRPVKRGTVDPRSLPPLATKTILPRAGEVFEVTIRLPR